MNYLYVYISIVSVTSYYKLCEENDFDFFDFFCYLFGI